MKVEIRPATPQDAEVIHQMIVALSAHHGDEAQITLPELQGVIARGRVPELAIAIGPGADVIGYVGFYPTCQLHRGQMGLHVHHIFVADQARGLGAGRALMGYVEAQARSRGLDHVRVTADPDNPMAAAYLAMGYEERPSAGERNFRKEI